MEKPDGPEAKGFLERFQGRADSYSKYRPSYPSGVLDTLRSEVGFVGEKVVADIGSGTGILSELFLANGNKVYCVEPNGDMRRAAEEKLQKYAPRFVSIDGTAEATGLEKSGVDLVAIGQALHWFDLEKSKAEFARILRKDGHVSIVYNYRKEEGRVEKAYGKLIQKFEKDRASTPDVKDEYAARFLEEKSFKKFVMPNSQILDLRGLLGRLASASYMPRQGDKAWAEIEREARGIIADYGERGAVELHYDAVLYLGKIKRG